MGFFDRLFGTGQQNEQRPSPQYRPQPRTGSGGSPQGGRSEDEIAVERYRYLLRTAPPEAIEQAHEEAFEKLTPEQRRLLFTQLSADAAPGDAPRGDDPHSLAQSATRSELRQPGTMERTMAGPSFGSMVGSSLLGTVAGYFIASALVSTFMPDPSSEADGSGDGSEGGDSGSDTGGDYSAGGYEDGGGFDGGFGGGGDFGGGDFGGGFDGGF
ncbi:hypothetical protein L1277_001368 [Okibacterium sp. HSC-33S16]|uniref:hypothetical protein n=1 Tax=Okibacterium sp. HSC-33S16 TaxID=2910965 RepID=UPI00209EC839|nr:hypothetical protein [Okibacterium sp. HSC-33S16]MCP2031277.1 hypothetical protein [Okibacterium sp. HSC-33S16]